MTASVWEVCVRVLLSDSVPAIGGSQRSLLELSQALTARGVVLHAAVPPGPLANAFREAGVTVHPVPVVRLRRRPHARTLPNLWNALLYLRALRAAMRRARPDVVHANGLTPALMAACVRRGRPLVWHVRDLDMPASAVRWLGSRVACAAAISEAVEERVCETMPAFCRGRVRLVRNGIDTTHFVPGDRVAARRQLGLPEQAPLVGMAANVAPWKRHDLFLAVAARVRRSNPQARFVMAAPDLFNEHRPLCAALRLEIARAGLADALTWLPDGLPDPARLFQALDVLVHPPSNEPFGRVLCEAMACGCPVVAANAAGPGMIVPAGVAGHLVQPGRCEAFVRPVLHLLAQPEEARRMGAAGRQHVIDNFDIARTAVEMQKTYADLLDLAARERMRRGEPAPARIEEVDDDD